MSDRKKIFTDIDRRRAEQDEIEKIRLEEKKLKKRQEKEFEKLIDKEKILNPNKSALIKWQNKKNNNIIYEGYYKDKLIFTIEKRLLAFHLCVKNKKIILEYKSSSSLEFSNMQKKAEKILKENLKLKKRQNGKK